MARTFNFDLALDEIIEKGFPANPELVEFVKKKENQEFLNIIVEIEIDSHGYPSNNWDDPGAGAEWHIHDVYVHTQFNCSFSLTTEMDEWLTNHLEEQVQQADAEDNGPEYDDHGL